MIFRFLLGVALALGLAARSGAGEAGVIVSMASVADRVRAQNPDLAAARLRIGEALGRMKQAGRPQNPRFETELEHNTNSSEGRVTIGLTQQFPVTSRLRLEKDISISELRAAESEVRDVERKLIAEARTALVKVLSIRRQRTLRREQVDVSAKLSDFIAKTVEKGEGSLLDAGQARLEAARLATEVRQLEAEETAALGVLKPLLGLKPGAALVASGDLPPTGIPAAKEQARRPDLEAARHEANAAATEVELEKAKKYEDIDVGIFGSAGRRTDEPGGTEGEGIIGIKLSIPFPWWNDNSGNVEAAVAKKQRKVLETTALDRTIHLEAAAARDEMEQWATLEREISIQLLPLADKQSELAENAWRNGQGELQGVLRAREQRLQLASSRLDALRDFHLARVRYQAALNQP